ncbi:MAG TPA: hypothetical protein VJI33_01325 [Candidatus Paceibacterota bacterium]
MIKEKIGFSYQGRNYEFETDADKQLPKNIVLPDGTVLYVTRWLESLESMPSFPEKLEVVDFDSEKPHEIARKLGTVLAKEIT